ncbi:MAG: hypothetical protein LBH04_05220 [Tannerellaceae bacterium]|nr:hypothetical protein [Tannerellaceae bacterium]
MFCRQRYMVCIPWELNCRKGGKARQHTYIICIWQRKSISDGKSRQSSTTGKLILPAESHVHEADKHDCRLREAEPEWRKRRCKGGKLHFSRKLSTIPAFPS